MSEKRSYPNHLTITEKQARKLGRYLHHGFDGGRVVIQQDVQGRLLVTAPEADQQWKIGVRGGWS